MRNSNDVLREIMRNSFQKAIKAHAENEPRTNTFTLTFENLMKIEDEVIDIYLSLGQLSEALTAEIFTHCWKPNGESTESSS